MDLLIKVSSVHCVPSRANPTDAGLDLRAIEDYTLKPNIPTMVDCGISVKIPPGHVGLLFSRSGFAKRNVTLANSVGVIDSDYRGPIKAALVNRGTEEQYIEAGDKVAQLVIVPIVLPQIVISTETEEQWLDTSRGAGGFGSTGKQ